MIDILGYAASAAVLATFLMPSMVSLRLVAIASNILFMLYGYLAHIPPVLVLHVALLPINVARLAALTGNRRWSWIDRRRGAVCVETASAVARRRQRLGV
jgi:CRP/FNR family cyclic AMP-dependent transcriptional regulator